MLHKRFQTWQHLPDYGATGGADAKIIIALVLFFAKRLLFIPIVLVGGLQGLIGLITSLLGARIAQVVQDVAGRL